MVAALENGTALPKNIKKPNKLFLGEPLSVMKMRICFQFDS